MPCSICEGPSGRCPDSRRCVPPRGDGVVPVVACVILRHGRVLIARRPEGGRHSGAWEFPGGKVAPGETLAEAARRELDEELGLRLTEVEAHLGTRRDPASAFELHFVQVQAEGEARAHEHSGLAWVTPPEVLDHTLAPGDRAFALAWAAGSGA